jgi:DNA repair photolyase
MAPIIPFLSDTDELLEATVRAIGEARARSITPIVLHLRPGAREWFFQWLADNHPELVPKYETLYAKGSYAPKAFQEEVGSRVRTLADKYRVGQSAPRDARRVRQSPPEPEPQQLTIL